MGFSGFRRVPAQARAAQGDRAQSKAFPAPTQGWLTAVNLANVPPGFAQVLENWFPTSTGIRLRSGSALWGTATDGTKPVESLLTYVNGNARQLFAAANGDIFPMSAPSSPTTIPASVVSGKSANYWTSVNFESAGGNFLTACNGADNCLLYDGTTWEAQTATSAHAITGVDTSTLSFVWVSHNRLFFVQKNTMTAWFLPVSSIAGAAQSINLAGVFQKGGSLVFGGTWAANTGNGLYNMTVFISSEGEYAVYQGTDPTNASAWSLVGVYDGSPPLGLNQNAMMRAGGDLLILTEAGIVSMTDIQTKDAAALSLSGVTRNIAPDWLTEQANRRALPWEIIKWPTKGYALVNCPVTDPDNAPICFVVNLETGAWCKYTGWDTRCLALHEDLLFFGTNAGTIVQAEAGGSDQGEIYVSTCVGHMDHLGAVGRQKTIKQARATFRTLSSFLPAISVAVDYALDLPSPPSATTPDAAPNEWDVGLWDTAVWSAGSSYYNVSTKWKSINRSGYAHGPVLQVSNGSQVSPSAELIIMEYTFMVGGLVV